jgi:hypothetical protein
MHLCEALRAACVTLAVGAFQMAGSRGVTKRGGRDLLVAFLQIVPPASETEARMDDPTRRCENDTGNETRLSGRQIPSGGPFLSYS